MSVSVCLVIVDRILMSFQYVSISTLQQIVCMSIRMVKMGANSLHVSTCFAMHSQTETTVKVAIHALHGYISGPMFL